jgi:hypothetical protein
MSDQTVNPSEGGSYILDPVTGLRTLVERGGSEPVADLAAMIAEPAAEPAPTLSSASEADQTDQTDQTAGDAPAPTSKRRGA